MSRDPDALDTPQAGPSRISPRTHAQDLYDEEDEDEEPTPKILTKPQLDYDGSSRVKPLELAQAAETPAERLRALLARVPPNTSVQRASRPLALPPSDFGSESDFEIPNVTAPSLARESLRDIFSRALLDDTPRKDSRRRNSIDLSEVEDSPRVQSVVRERAKIKEKRRSMSDEEAEKFSKSSQKSEASFRSSAATFDALRQKLQSSTSAPIPRPLDESVKMPERTQRGFSLRQFISTQSAGDTESQSDVELSDGPAEASGETATILKHVNRELSASTSQIPVSTSMTLKSFQMPSQIQMQSNLMEQDSDMQNIMQRLDSSYEGPSRSNQQDTAAVASSVPVDISSVSFPFPRPNETASPPRAHSKSHFAHGNSIARRVSGSSSRSSSLSAAELQDRMRDGDRDKLHERERFWNKPSARSPGHPTTPERNRYPSNSSPSYNTTIRGSPHGLARRGSGASIQSFDDGRSSVASSISSRANYREGIRETDGDRLKERERMWNKSQDRLSRSSSSLSLRSPSDRSRTTSMPIRPDSAQSFHSSGQRPLSWHSAAGSASPGGTVYPTDKDGWVSWERERNWRSPNPKWEFQVPRSMSPLPEPPEAGPSPYAYKGIPKDSPLHPSNRKEPRFVVPSYGSPSRTRTQSMSEHPSTRLYSPLKHYGTESRIPRPSTPSSRPSSGEMEDNGQAAGYTSRFGWSFPRNRVSLRKGELEDDEEPVPQASTSKIPHPSLSKRSSHLPVRLSSVALEREREMQERMLRPKLRAREDIDHSKGHRRTSTEFHETLSQVRARVEPEPVEVSTEVEAEVPTDIETESDRESHATTEPTPLAKPTPLPPPAASPSPPRTPPLAASTPRGEISNDSEQFYSIAAIAKPSSPPTTPPREKASEPEYSLQTPPRRSQTSTSQSEFETPPPPRDMPDLPGPPSSEEEVDEGHTPVGNPFANLTAIKTPKPPGGWEATPAPAERATRPEQTDEDQTPPAAQPSESIVVPTPAPPGGWLPTPASSLRRKSILKVRFDVDPNTSGDSLASVPLVGPSDSMSDIFPAVDPTSTREHRHAADKDSSDAEERPTTPPMSRSRITPRSPRSPGVRILDAFGRETTEEDERASTPGQRERKDDKKRKTTNEKASSSALSRKRGPATPVRIVDAMGREITEVSIEDSEHSESYDVPISRAEALVRVRQTITSLVEDLGDSDASREILPRNNQRLNDLYSTSNTARAARKNINESLQKYKSVEDDLRSKYGSMRESMNRNKLLPPSISPRKYSINFLNIWVLWILLIFQIFVLIYMYHLSTVRAKQIFLTTYYDAFQPDLFLHLTKHRAIPSSASWSLSVISDTLIRAGWRGLVSEIWGNVTLLVDDVRNNLWDAWAQQRTPAWPPT